MQAAITMPDQSAGYRIRVRNKDFQFIGEASHWIRLQIELNHNKEPSKWVLELDRKSEAAKLFREIAADPNNGGKGGVYVERNGYFILSGPMTTISESVSYEKGQRLIVGGQCDLRWLFVSSALPHPQYFRSPYMTLDGTPNTGHSDYIPDKASPSAQYASWHIHTVVRTNIGEAAPSQRPPLPFITTRDNSVGYLIPSGEYTIARGENLFELCRGIADYSDYMGHPIRMVAYQYQSGANPDGSPAYKIRFECVASQNKPNVILSPELGTITEWTYTRQAPEGNKILMGGSGEGPNRRFAFGEDSASIGLYGPIERFEEYTGFDPNAPQSEELATLKKEINAKLAEYAEQTTFEFTFQETPTVQYGRDFQIGDIVRVQIEDKSTTDVVRSVSFDVSGDGKEKMDVVVGSQSAISKGLRLFDDVKTLKYRYDGLSKRTGGK